MTLKMPDRQPRDGAVSVTRGADGEGICIAVTDSGEEQGLHMTDYNAWRILGMLSVMLELPLSKASSKAIKFDSGPEMMVFGPSKPLNTLGDRVAWNLMRKAAAEKLLEEGLEVVEATATQAPGVAEKDK